MEIGSAGEGGRTGGAGPGRGAGEGREGGRERDTGRRPCPEPPARPPAAGPERGFTAPFASAPSAASRLPAAERPVLEGGSGRCGFSGRGVGEPGVVPRRPPRGGTAETLVVPLG